MIFDDGIVLDQRLHVDDALRPMETPALTRAWS